MSNENTTALTTRLAEVNFLIGEYWPQARFEAERAITRSEFAPGPSHTERYRKLFDERELLHAQLGMEPPLLEWPLTRK